MHNVGVAYWEFAKEVFFYNAQHYLLVANLVLVTRSKRARYAFHVATSGSYIDFWLCACKSYEAIIALCIAPCIHPVAKDTPSPAK
jgi:hypothetical protein